MRIEREVVLVARGAMRREAMGAGCLAVATWEARKQAPPVTREPLSRLWAMAAMAANAASGSVARWP